MDVYNQSRLISTLYFYVFLTIIVTTVYNLYIYKYNRNKTYKRIENKRGSLILSHFIL